MSQETFSKLIELMPLTQNEGFLFSCLFEPTIHPNFIPFLQQIPALGREKVFFTTNLAKRLPQEMFYELSQVNIHHINVSLDSLDPAIYEDLRGGAKFDTFMYNLENLVSVFGKYPKAPRIRYITMVFKQNLNEVVDLVSVCHKRYLADLHEVRTPFNITLSHMDEEWIKKSIISRKEWDELGKELSRLPFRTSLFNPLQHSMNLKTIKA
jgi:molybdenum cofactor biosynthesis enzyme MoaA